MAIIPADCEYAPRLAACVNDSSAAFLFDFGRARNAAVRILSWEQEAARGRGRLDVLGRVVDVSVPAPGEHQAHNAAGVMAACVAAGIDSAAVADVLAGLEAQAGRGASFLVPLGGGAARIIDDSYNANPVSMASAIATLARHTPEGKGRRIAVLGEMLEIGESAPECHRELAGLLADAGVAEVIGVGAMMTHMVSALPSSIKGMMASSPAEAGERLMGALRPGDVVLIKGSNGSGVHKVVASLRNGAVNAVIKG